ncbi:MAG: arginine--tRNA ligase [Candidatus Omnitrophota bacterium]|nr:arginine--tRNA ligase [Candidatus Omnitrophota bacterium]
MIQDLRSSLEILIETVVLELSSGVQKEIPPIQLEIPHDKANGDLACNIALKIAADLKQNPFHIANKLKEALSKRIENCPLSQKIKNIEVKHPGFINFFLSDESLYEILKQIIKENRSFGRSKIGKGKRVQIEFVSANPTGPLSVAHARQAAVGDALANILKFLGFNVSREYYINDEGTQIDILGKSILSRLEELLGEVSEFPENGYQGEYIYDIAKDFIEKQSSKKTETKKDFKFLSQYGVDYILKIIKNDLDDFKLRFDIFSRQSQIAKRGNVEKVIGVLRKKGFIYEKDGATWFKSTTFGDDKDRVLIKSDGSFTYLAPDIVYHKDKFKRGFNWVINIWGPDHHGYIPRLKAAVEALGYKKDMLSIIIVQLATLFKQGKPITMSTRRGQYISLREVVDEVGVDAARFFFLMRRTDSHLDFDLELAKKQSPENPVFYIQYAHARIASIINLAKENKITSKNIDFGLIKQPEELGLIKKLNSFPDVLVGCFKLLDPYALVNFLQELATDFHKFYDNCRVINDDNLPLTLSRLKLIEAVKVVLESGLNLLGISAPDKM